MGVPYRLRRKTNPQKPAAPGKWYAVPKTGKAVDEKIMTRRTTEDTTVSGFELSAEAKLAGKSIHTTRRCRAISPVWSMRLSSRRG